MPAGENAVLQDWEHGFVGNNPGTVSGLAKRASLARVMVRAFRPIHARRLHQELATAA
jgi:hypothetical protein